ncbi:Integrase catalytic domain-containing protein [Citrus sinensis]|nr:Integrase catalytic domain-containing protein [Citrus sinensis]
MDSHRYKTHVENRIMKIVKGTLVLIKAEKIGANLFMLKRVTLQEANACVASNGEESTMMWHLKLIHMSEQGLKILSEQKLLSGLKSVSLPFCEYCVISRSITRTKCILDLIHSDIWKSPDTSMGGAKYMVTFIDDYSRRCWMYPIKKKSDVFSVFKEYKARVELESEAVKTACYIVNRSSSIAIRLKTTMKMWTGKPADYSYLHAFRCPVYVMYNAQERTKLDSKSRRCIFLRYTDGVNDQLQRKDRDDGTIKEKSETVPVYVENNPEDSDSSEVALEHKQQEPVESEAPKVHRSTHERRPLSWHSEYVTEINMTAMQEEIEALHKNKTWELKPLPHGRKAIGNKWVYKIKRDGNDQVERYRARLVVKGYAQKEDIDFNEIFSLVAQLTTVRVVLAMCATFDLHLEQFDVKIAFLHRELEEEIYMLQPEGFAEKRKENLACRLNKSLYSLKQAPRCWYKRFDSFIMSLGYNRLSSYHCAYYKRFEDNDFIILLLYVDDMLVVGPNKDRLQELKAQLAKEFEMKDLGPINKILGMQIHRDRNNRKIWFSQKNYLKKILRRFNMHDCKPISTPLPVNFKLSSSMCPSNEAERKEMSRVPYASTVGSLMFAMICTRPDNAQAVGAVSRYMANPRGEHWIAIKRILDISKEP